MGPWTKRSLATGGVLTAVAAAFCAGGWIGFGEGFASQMGLTAPGNAAYTVAVLRTLRCGRTESAISLLEAHLDTQIVEWVTIHDAPLHFDFIGLRSSGNALAEKILSYRRKYPSEKGYMDGMLQKLELVRPHADIDTSTECTPSGSNKALEPTA